MFKKTIITLIVFLVVYAMTSVKCEINIYNNEGKTLDIGFEDVTSSFGPRIPSEGIEVFQ